jgi:hypothetical protein
MYRARRLRLSAGAIPARTRQLHRGYDPAKKSDANQLGALGEVYAYWYLRRLGYIFVARNYRSLCAKGELDPIGFDGDALALWRFAPAKRSKTSLHSRS